MILQSLRISLQSNSFTLAMREPANPICDTDQNNIIPNEISGNVLVSAKTYMGIDFCKNSVIFLLIDCIGAKIDKLYIDRTLYKETII